MMASKIPWTEETWNPVTGCTKIAAGCQNCYAEAMAKRFWGNRKFSDVQCHEDRLDIPVDWKKPRKIFVCSMSDLFHEKVSIGFLTHVFDVIKQCPQHTFQILTKRPDRALKMMWGRHDEAWRYFGDGDYHPNIWCGISCSTQDDLDRMVPIAMQIPAAVRFISYEPALEDIIFRPQWMGKFQWAIVGTESGSKRRPISIPTVRSIVGKFSAEMAVFLKQIEMPGCRKCRFEPCTHLHGHRQISILSKDPAEWPADLRIQEYPNGR